MALYLVYHFFTVAHDMAQSVKFIVKAVLDNSAILCGDRRLVHDRILDQLNYLAQVGDLAVIARDKL